MRKVSVLLPALLAALALANIAAAQRTEEPGRGGFLAMKQDEQKSGKPNPNAPPELSRFAFLVGKWRCEAKLKRDERTSDSLKGTWEGRYILDGYVIADEYRMTTPAGELLVLGENLRSYDAKNKTWNMKWLNALAGTWVDLGPEELGGVKADEKTITYIMKEDPRGRSVGAHVLTRATYINNSENHFTWRGERSNDRKTWEEFLVIECYRNRN